MTVLRQQIVPALRTLLATMLISVPAAPVSAQAVAGVVVGADSRAVENVVVAVLASDRDTVFQSMLAADGRFLFDLPEPGDYRLRATALGFQTLTTRTISVPTATMVTVELRLEADAIALEPLFVTSERIEPAFMPDVRRRARMGFGRLVSREELDEFAGMQLKDVLRMTGLRVTERRQGQMVVPLVTARQPGLRQCYATLYLNGIKQYSVADPQDDALFRAYELMEFRPQEIEAVEIYRGAAQVPAEFSGSDAECGVVAVWLRTGAEVRTHAAAVSERLPVLISIAAVSVAVGGDGAPREGIGAELSGYWPLSERIEAGIRLRGSDHILSAAQTAALMAGKSLLPPDPGARELRMYTADVGVRMNVLPFRRISPLVLVNGQLGRRAFSVVRNENQTPSFSSLGVGFGLAGGIELKLTSSIGAEAMMSHDWIAFSSFRNLDAPGKKTSARWSVRALRAGLVARF